MNIRVTVTGWDDPATEPESTDILVKSPSGLTGTFTKFANEIHTWCFEQGIEADMIGKWSDDGKHISRWRIHDPAHRTMFALRWS